MQTLDACLERTTNNFAAVRMIAATSVLFAHSWVVTIPGLQTRDFFHVFGFSLDHHGVHAFFILSGLLLTRSLLKRPDPLRFIVARVVRYVPAIFVAAVFAALVVGPLATRLGLAAYLGSGAAFDFIAATTTLWDVNATLPGVFERNAQGGILFVPLWTVHYELVFGVVLAAIAAVGLLGPRWLAAAGLVFTLAVNAAWFWNGESLASFGSPHHLVRFSSTFGIGVALGVFADRVPVSNRLLLALALIAAPLAYSHVAALAGMVLLAYAILCIGFSQSMLVSALARLGVWSYGFYVWGFLIEQCVAYAAPDWDGIAVFAVAFGLALVCGALSWRFVEQPTLRWTDPITAGLRRAFGGRRQTETTPLPAPARRI